MGAERRGLPPDDLRAGGGLMRLTSKERGDRVARDLFGRLEANTNVREHLAALVKREVDEATEAAVELVHRLASAVDPRLGGSRELFAAAKVFLAAHGVR